MLCMEDTSIYNLQHCTGGEGAAVSGKFLKIAGVPIYFVQGCLPLIGWASAIMDFKILRNILITAINALLNLTLIF